MPALGLELVDVALLACRDGELLAGSPGVALLDAAGPVTGQAAADAAWLRPVQANDRYWMDLGTDPLPRPALRAGSHADLAYAQLASLWQSLGMPEDEVAIALPGSLRPQQAALALAIARSAGWPVAGLVDLAVAACAELDTGERLLHLDLHRHQAVLTRLAGASQLQREAVEVVPRAGLESLHGAWAQLVSELMVRRTRFDPLHQATTEQQLHERLPGWLATLKHEDAVEVSVEVDSGSFSATLQRDQFALAVEAYYSQLVERVRAALRPGEAMPLALSARAASLPALRERLEALPGVSVVELPPAAAAIAAAARLDALRLGDEPSLVLSLARRHPRKPAAPAARSGRAPTHLVHAGRAHALGAEPLWLGTAAGPGRQLVLEGSLPGVSRRHCSLAARAGSVELEDHSRHGTWLNGQRVAGRQPVLAGDRLRLGTPGVVLELVAVD